MTHAYREILNPVGEKADVHAKRGTAKGKGGGKAVIGLLNNSKPNVDFFLKAIESEILREQDQYDVFNVVKSRSAAPCANIDALAERCDYVINAVAD